MQRFNIIGLFEPPDFSNGGGMVLRQERTGDNTTSPVFTARSGFSLIEILVAVAVFAVVALVLVSVTDSAFLVTMGSKMRMNADSASRGALDRMAADFVATGHCRL